MKKGPLLIIFLIVFIDLLGFGIVIPILPYYAKSLNATGTTVGLLMACYSGMQFLFSPFWGQMSDRYGRRPILLICIFGMGLGMLILGLAKTLPFLFMGRLLGGFFGANISVASAYIADVTPVEKRARGMALIGFAFGMGFLFGPALGGMLSKTSGGYGTGALVAFGLSCINLVVAFFLLKEPPVSQEERVTNRNKLDRKLFSQVFSVKLVALGIGLFFIVTMGMAQLETVFGLFIQNKFSLDAFHAGLILALVALVMGATQGSLGRLVDKFGEKKLIYAGQMVMVVSLTLVGFGFSLPLFIAFVLTYTFGFSLSNPSISSLVSKNAPQGMQGATMGFYQSAGSLGRMIGPVIAGFSFQHVSIGAPFFIASVFVGIGLVLFWFLGE